MLNKLENGLDSSLTYHNLEHTLDVLRVTVDLCKFENIDSKNTILLKTAAVFHDSGFLEVYQGHEEKSCTYAKHYLPEFGYNMYEIEKICGMIGATKIPQIPKTKLESILSDADLDYLGREDFEKIGETLFREFKWKNIVKSRLDWDKIQISFLQSHSYFTETSKKRRTNLKNIHLKLIKERVKPVT